MEARYARRGSVSSSTPAQGDPRRLDGGALKQAFRTTPEEFDAAFDKWLKERLQAVPRQAAPGRLRPRSLPRTRRRRASPRPSASPEPSGEIAAVITANRSDGEADVVLVSTKDGTVIQNLTGGFDTDWESFASTASSWPPLGGLRPRATTWPSSAARQGRSLFLVSASTAR